jgi:hypothetical protein
MKSPESLSGRSAVERMGRIHPSPEPRLLAANPGSGRQAIIQFSNSRHRLLQHAAIGSIK